MVKCLVPKCKSRFNNIGNKRKMSFFRIPNAGRNPKKWPQAEKWLDFCGIDKATFCFERQLQVVCEKHFHPEDLETSSVQNKRNYQSKRVKTGAFPTIFNVDDISEGDFKRITYESDVNDNIDIDTVEDWDNIEEGLEMLSLNNPSELMESAASLSRWPPDVKIAGSELKYILTCGICDSYFFKATTLTECLHTFCKGCLFKHFRSNLQCPTCDILVHPTDPSLCMKSDSIMQDIVYKIFPERLINDQKDEQKFYVSCGLNPSKVCAQDEEIDKKVPKVEMISLRLDYAGTTESIPWHRPLSKRYLRIPNDVTIAKIIKFLEMKIQLPAGAQAALFINCFMLNESLTIQRLEKIFGDQMLDKYSGLFFLQYGIIPKGEYFDNGLLVSTKHL